VRSRRFLSKHKSVIAFFGVYLTLGGVLALLLAHDWRLETTSDISCTASLSSPPSINNQYVQISLEKQQPEEPAFDGHIFINLGNYSGTEARTIQLDTSQGRDYYDNRDFLNSKYDPTSKTLRMTDQAAFELVPTRGSYKLFPFDSASFDVTLSFEPQIPLSLVMVENRIHGFVLDREKAKISQNSKGEIRIQFLLSRDPLTQLTAVVLCVASSVFLILIIRLEKTESLAASVTSFFFSLWSVRAILGSELKTFPTLLDLWILTMCVLMVFGLVGKLAWARIIPKSKSTRDRLRSPFRRPPSELD
jgi:hypothetical protein